MKKQTNKRIHIIILLLIALFLGTACAQQAQQELPEVIIVATVPPLPQPATTVEVSSEEVSSEEVFGEGNGHILTIWADEIRAPALEMAASAFMTSVNDVTVVVEQYPLSLIQQNTLAAATRPDIIVGSHTWVGELAEKNLLLPVDLGSQSSQFIPVSLDAFTHNGILYGLPTSTENAAFFINQDLVSNCPATWRDVKTFSQTRVVESGDTQFGFVRSEGDAYHFYPVQSAFGGYLFGKSSTQFDVTDVGLDSAGSFAAANFYNDLLDEGLQPAAMTMDTMRVWFETGQSSMTIAGSWALDSFRAADLNYKICDIPSETAPGQVLVESQGFMITSFSDDPQLAQTFLTEWVAAPGIMQAIADLDFRLSAYLPVRNAADPDVLAIGNVGANGLPIPGIPEMTAVWEPWETAVTLLSRQQAQPEEAFTNAANQIRAAIAETQEN